MPFNDAEDDSKYLEEWLKETRCRREAQDQNIQVNNLYAPDCKILVFGKFWASGWIKTTLSWLNIEESDSFYEKAQTN